MCVNCHNPRAGEGEIPGRPGCVSDAIGVRFRTVAYVRPGASHPPGRGGALRLTVVSVVRPGVTSRNFGTCGSCQRFRQMGGGGRR